MPVEATSSFLEPKQVVRTEDVWNAYWRANELFKRQRLDHLVGTIEEDELSKEFLNQLNRIKNKLVIQDSPNQSRSFWNLFSYLFPEDESQNLKNTYTGIMELCEAFLYNSENRDRVLTTMGFHNEIGTPMIRSVQNQLADLAMSLDVHIKTREIMTYSNLSLAINRMLTGSSQSLHGWWEEAFLSEDPVVEIQLLSDVENHLKKAARKIIFMMDEARCFLKSTNSRIVWDALDAARKMVLLLMNFTTIPEADRVIMEQLEKLKPLLFSLFLELRWIRFYSSIIQYRSKSIFHTTIYDRMELLNYAHGGNVGWVTKMLDTLIAESLDRRKSHWKYVLDSCPQISTNDLGTPASKRFSDELTEMLPERQGTADQSCDDSIHTLLDDENLDNIQDKDHDWILKAFDKFELPNVKISMKEAPLLVGKGMYSEVYVTRRIGDNVKLAVKIPVVQSGKSTTNVLEHFFREVKNWSKMRKYLRGHGERHGAKYISPIIGYAYIGGFMPGLVSVYMPWGNLQDFVRNEIPSLGERLSLLMDVARAIEFVHTELFLVHADIRAANILIDSSGHAVLSDFGLSADPIYFDNVDHRTSNQWLAPELLTVVNGRFPHVSRETDIWAFGCVCIEVLTGAPPTPKERSDILEAEANGLQRIPLENIRTDHWDLIADCWNIDPRKRPRISTIIRCLGDLIAKLQ